MAITIEGCDRMIRAERGSGKKLMVGHNMRCMSTFRTMKEIIDSGLIGEVKAVWVRHFVASGGYWYYHDWHGTREKATSLLLQKGSHDIDMIHWLSGQYSKKVAAFGSLDVFGGDKPNNLRCPECDEKRTCMDSNEEGLIQCAFRREIDVEDNNVMIMELDCGIKASYLQCHFTTDYQRNYVFIGTKGTMENLDLESKVTVKLRRKNSWTYPIDRIYNIASDQGGHGGADAMITDQFLDVVLDGKPPVASPIDGRMSVATGCCGAESMRQGGVMVEVPPPP